MVDTSLPDVFLPHIVIISIYLVLVENADCIIEVVVIIL